MQHSIRPAALAAALASALLVLSACKRPEGTPEPTTTGSAGSTQQRSPTTDDAATPTRDARVNTAAADLPAVAPGDLIANEPTSAGPSSSEGATLSAADRSFVTEAAGSGLYEVAVARLATEKASDPAVKDYAAMLLDHHRQANDKLKLVAKDKGITVPAEIPAAKQRKIDALSQASGAAFDRQFIQEVGLHDHKNDIALFEKASKNAKDSEVRSFAENTLPTLRSHLDSAQKLPSKSAPTP